MPTSSNPFYNNDGFRKAVPYLSVAVGLGFLSYGVFGRFDDPQVGHFCEGLGKTILAGGIFALLLKTYQFMGVFKEELSKIVYDAKFLSNRKDLPEVWEAVSKVLFKNKFPKITKEITDSVRDIYFPTKQISYFGDYSQSLQITSAEGDKIKVVQSNEYTIYPNEDKFPTSSTNAIKFGSSKDDVSFKILSYKVDGAECKTYKLTETVKDNTVINTIRLELKGKESYRIETEIEKIYSLKEDNVIGFGKDSLIYNLTLQIHLEEGIDVAFFDRGTLKKWTHKKPNNRFCSYEYKGIIFPKQGYLIFVSKDI
ncbi:MAG TPA: hypothetical protein VIU12_14390 [Chryseolinea sp.]